MVRVVHVLEPPACRGVIQRHQLDGNRPDARDITEDVGLWRVGLRNGARHDLPADQRGQRLKDTPFYRMSSSLQDREQVREATGELGATVCRLPSGSCLLVHRPF